MPRIALINMFIGFLIITFAAASGSFIANDTTQAFLKNKELLNSWSLILSASAHGHTNLFGILHVLFGLTIPYSTLSLKIKKYQTIGLGLGTFAMGVLMYVKSTQIPSENLQFLDIFIGSCLSLTLLSIAAHSFGLFNKAMQRT